MQSGTSFKILTDELVHQRQHLKAAVDHINNQDTDMFIISKDRQYLPCHRALLALFSPLVCRLLAEVPCCVAPTIFLPDFPAHLIRKFLHLLKSGQAVPGKNSNVDIKFLHKIGDALSVDLRDLSTGEYVNNPLGSVKIKQEIGGEISVKQERVGVDIKQEMIQVNQQKINIKRERFFNKDTVGKSELNDSEEESEYVEQEVDDHESITDEDIAEMQSEESPVVELTDCDRPPNSEAAVQNYDDIDIPIDHNIGNNEDPIQHGDELTQNIQSVLAIINQEDDQDESEIIDNDFNQPNLPFKIASEKGSSRTGINEPKSTKNGSDVSDKTIIPRTPTHNKDDQINSLIPDTPEEERLIASTAAHKDDKIHSNSDKTEDRIRLIPDTPPKQNQTNSAENGGTEISKPKYLRELDPVVAFEKTIFYGGFKFTKNAEYMEFYDFAIEEDAPKIKVETEEDKIKKEEDKIKRRDIMSSLQKMLDFNESRENVISPKDKFESISHKSATNVQEVDESHTKLNNSSVSLPRDEIDELLDGNDDMDSFQNGVQTDFRKNGDPKATNKLMNNLDSETSGGKRKRNKLVRNVNKNTKADENYPELLPNNDITKHNKYPNQVKRAKLDKYTDTHDPVNYTENESDSKIYLKNTIEETTEDDDSDEEAGKLILTRDADHQAILKEIYDSFSKIKKKGSKTAWTCTECKREFSSKKLVDSHIDFEHTDHVFHKCSECGLLCKTNDSLTRHTEKAHKKKNEN